MTSKEIAELKLECLKIAKEITTGTGDVLAKAKELFEFVYSDFSKSI